MSLILGFFSRMAGGPVLGLLVAAGLGGAWINSTLFGCEITEKQVERTIRATEAHSDFVRGAEKAATARKAETHANVRGLDKECLDTPLLELFNK